MIDDSRIAAEAAPPKDAPRQDSLEVAIVGAGPAGLAVANALQKAGRRVALFDKGPLGHSVGEFPTFMTFFSTSDLLEIDEFPLTIAGQKPTRREYLVYLHRFAKDRRLDVRAYSEVRCIVPPPRPGAPFTLELTSLHHGDSRATARFVVVATGAWERPIMLGVPGEDLPKVSHYYREPFPYMGRRVMIVGGRNSAIETALELWRAGAQVDLSYRGREFTGRGVKYWIVPDIENRLKNDEIHGHFGTEPVEFFPDRVRLRLVEGGDEYDVPNDFVLCLTGYEPDTALLRAAGVRVDAASLIPEHHPETFETNVPGLFVAGVLLQGNMSGGIFIENSRHHGANILRGIERAEAAHAAAS